MTTLFDVIDTHIDSLPKVEGPDIGAAVWHERHGAGYICDATRPAHYMAIMDKGGMVEIKLQFRIAFPHGFETVDDFSIVELLANAGARSMENRANDPATLAAWELLDSPFDPEAEKVETIRRKIADLSFANIPGYFPTPAPVVARMIEAAGDLTGLSVLEPSAGSGAIADAARDAGAGCVHCVERQNALAAILRDKGHKVANMDFMETGKQNVTGSPIYWVDAVIMNPPFEKGQDVQHVKHAWRFVRPGGRLVSIMSAGVTFRADCAAFRAWVDDLGGELEKLPSGSFKQSGTGVETVMLTLRKDA